MTHNTVTLQSEVFVSYGDIQALHPHVSNNRLALNIGLKTPPSIKQILRDVTDQLESASPSELPWPEGATVTSPSTWPILRIDQEDFDGDTDRESFDPSLNIIWLVTFKIPYTL